MNLHLNDELVQQIKRLADREQRAPVEIVAEAIRLYEAGQKNATSRSFWSAVMGIGASGQADIAERDEEILAAEVDPIRGWGLPDDETGHSS